MGFRKESHQTEMPELVKLVLMGGQAPTATQSGRISTQRSQAMAASYRALYGGTPSTISEFKGWSLFRVVTLQQIRTILRARWSQASNQDAEATVAELIRQDFLSFKKEGTWNIHRVPVTPYPFPGFSGYKSDRPKHKVKPGVCPRCGATVQNTNRHKNELHSGEECQLNRVRQVMET